MLVEAIVSLLMILGGIILIAAACLLFIASTLPRYRQIEDDFTPRHALFISTPMFLAGVALLVLS